MLNIDSINLSQHEQFEYKFTAEMKQNWNA